MLQRPLAPVEPLYTERSPWPQTKWEDMQTMDLNSQPGVGVGGSADQGPSAPRPASGHAPKPKFKLTGIKIGGKQIVLPKAATPPPPAPLPEYLNKLVAVTKKTNKLLKKPLQPLPEALLSPPNVVPLSRTCVSTDTDNSRPGQADRAGDVPQGTSGQIDFHQWVLASRMAAQQHSGDEQEGPRPQPVAPQPPAALTASKLQPAAAFSPDATTPSAATPSEQDPASPAASCNDAQQAQSLGMPRHESAEALQAAREVIAGLTEAQRASSALTAGVLQQEQHPEGAPAADMAGPSNLARQKSPKTADVLPAPVATAAAPAQLPGSQKLPTPASSASSDSSSSSSSSSSDDSSSSSDSDVSSSGTMLSGGRKASSASKASSISGSKRTAHEVCGPSPKRAKTATAGKSASAVTRMDSVREDGEIGALRDMHAEEVDYDRRARGSGREQEYEERPRARDSDRRRDEGDERLQRRSDDYYRKHNWKYNGLGARRDSERDEDRRRRDRDADRERETEEERRRRDRDRDCDRERERELEEERRRRDRERGSGRASYEGRRRSRDRSRTGSRRPAGRSRSRSRPSGDRDRSRGGRYSRDRSRSRDARRRSARRSSDRSPDRRLQRRSADKGRTPQKSVPAAEVPAEDLPRAGSPSAQPGSMAPPTARSTDKPLQAAAPVPQVAQPVAAGVPANKSISETQAVPSALATAASCVDPSANLADAARAFVLMLRESLNKAASEGNDTSADLHKQWASRKKLAKMFVDKGLEYERQLRALVAAGADMAERMPLLKEMCSATAEGIVLTLKAQVHFLRWAALGERMIAQNKGLEWAAAIHDPAALNLKGMQPRHVLANEYQSFLAEMQHSDVRQLFSGAKARLQRTGHSHPAHKAFLSQISDFVELARLFMMRLEMVTAVRTNAFQGPSLKQHEAGLRSVEDAHRQAQRLQRQQLQQRGGPATNGRGPRGPQQQPAAGASPATASRALGQHPLAAADAGESFQRPSPGDSNNSETTASTPPTLQDLQPFPAPVALGGLQPVQMAAKTAYADPSTYVIPQRFARSQEVILNSHQRFVTAYDLGASREIQLLLMTVMESENAAAARTAALVAALGVDAALMDPQAVPALGRQCIDGLCAYRDSLGLSPAGDAKLITQISVP